MELTIDQALKKGVEAHKSGQLQEAHKYYTAILKAVPKHPDANHNIGVLFLGSGRVQEALPLLETALESNPRTEQFWVSYIDALIKLDRLDDAKTILGKARKKGLKGDGFDKWEQSLSQTAKIDKKTPENSMVSAAKQLRENGQFNQAIDLLKEEIIRFPNDPNISALLSHCYILSDNIEEATLQLNRAKCLDPNNALIAWNEVRFLLKNKSVSEALLIARSANKRFPDDVEGMNALGSCLRASNNHEEALFFLNKALALKPNYAEALINRGLIYLAQKNKSKALADLEQAHKIKPFIKDIWDIVIGLMIEVELYSRAKSHLTNMIKIDPLNEKIFTRLAICNQRMGNYEAAVAAYKKALAFQPDFAEAYCNMGDALQKQGQLEEALVSYNKALSLKPDIVHAYINVGNVLQEQGHLGEALEAYNKALALQPDYAEAYYNMGIVLRNQDKLVEAIEAYKNALAIKPDYAEVYNNMGNIFKDQGKLEEALEAYYNALDFKSDYTEAFYNIGHILRRVVFTKPSPKLQSLILSMLKRKTYVSSEISKAAVSLLKFEPAINGLFQHYAKGNLREFYKDCILGLSELPLLLKLMSDCLLLNFELEEVLTEIRSIILYFVSRKPIKENLLHFQSALALQCFTNEYIYIQTASETTDLKTLEASVEKSISTGQQPSPQALLCLASYKALNEYEWCNLLTLNSDIEEVFTRQILEPKKEARIKADIAILTGITDRVSEKVRQQYEQNPYPRWVNLRLPLKSTQISKFVNQFKLKIFDDKIIDVQEPSILVAGCGTGKHSITTASRFHGSEVLAIDLSLSSLAYAKRKTKELGIKNIEYMQADILNVGKLERKFDIVESFGVLHHMDDPMAGWLVLTGRLKMGGLMKIGLYSEFARENIAIIRAEIAKLGIGSSASEIKSFRNAMIKSNKKHHKEELSSPDFYSTSTVRDLLFHVQEHRFTIPKIKQGLNDLGLKFCGFESPDIVRKFKSNNTAQEDLYNLDKWHEFEVANPRSFVGIYEFWCQKVA